MGTRDPPPIFGVGKSKKQVLEAFGTVGRLNFRFLGSFSAYFVCRLSCHFGHIALQICPAVAPVVSPIRFAIPSAIKSLIFT